MRKLLAMALLALALGLAACGEDEGGLQGPEGSSGGSDTSAGAGGTSAPAETTPETKAAKMNGCEVVEQPPAKPDGGAKKPKAPLPAGQKPTLLVRTNCGSFTIQLDPALAPKTSASLVSLAKSGFYKDTIFHRIVPGFVIQGGDPTGAGNGGPGYSTVDKPPANAKYTHGVVAMAKTPDEKPGTSGSQFYVVTAKDSQLPPEYAVVGKVTKGLKVVDRIGKLGDPASGGTGTPLQVVVIQDVKVAGA